MTYRISSAFLQPLVLSYALCLMMFGQGVHATGFEHMPKKQFNVFVFSKTAGWHHASILSGVNALQKMSDKHFFNMVWHEEGRYFNDEYLKNVDVVVFLATTGDVLNDAEQAAFEGYIKQGKGFVGIHSATDTEYDWAWYQQLVGHTFVIHPEIQTAKLQVESREFPGLESMPDSLLWTDEWYDFTPVRNPNLHYILSVDENSYAPRSNWGNKQGEGMGEFHPIAWYQEFDGGRVFYTALGHTDAVYQDVLFQTHLYGGIYWAATGKGITP
ncbi:MULTISPECIES: ThuA domain-containing protein [Shewanella]|uniref:ThuA domain-containing protein n=1 Tax=Shewanella TaxID=22 RepID=UPI003D160A8D